MPLVAVSAAATGPQGTWGGMHSHTFKLNTDPEVQMSSEDGRFVLVDGSGNAIVKVTFACLGCHNGVDASARDTEWIYRNAPRIHRCR